MKKIFKIALISALVLAAAAVATMVVLFLTEEKPD
jgi:flagellar basal body-associated protein FliL